MLRIWLVGLALVAGCAYVASSAALDRAAAEAASASLPSDERLDALLAAHDWTGLADALSHAKTNDEAARRLDWLSAKLVAGGGALLGFLYSRDLWSAGQQIKSDDPMGDLRVTAGLFTLYTFMLIAIDGAKCEDQSAPSRRVDHLLEANQPILQFLKAQRAKIKAKVIDLALTIERKTAPLRKDDDFLCRDGLDQILAGLEGGQVKDVAPPPGGSGKTYEVTAPPDYKPKFLPPSAYEPEQRKAREAMRASLQKLIE